MVTISIVSALCRHINVCSGCNPHIRLPEACHSLRLSIEVETRLAVKGAHPTACDTSFVPSETEHWQGTGIGTLILI